MKPNSRYILTFFLGILLLSSCGLQPEQPTITPTVLITPPNTPFPTATVTPRPAPSARPIVTPVQQASLVPTETISVQPSPVDEELYFVHPLSIEHLRQGEYPGSSINIEQQLEPGDNYRRYYVSYRSEGLRIYALMTVPDGDAPDNGWPVVIFNHGYIAPDAYRTTERYEDYIDEIASNGYIVFRSDYRGHGLSEGEARGAFGYPDYTIDVLNAIASVKKYADADPDRIGMWGHSMGGFITLRCMVISKDIKIGVIWAGVVAPYPDLVYNWPQNAIETPEIANNWRTSLAVVYGSPSVNPAFWDAISANSYLTLLSGPIQLQHSTGDVEVPVEFSTNLYQQLAAIGIPVELYTYENDNHNLTNSFSVAMRRTIETFDLYLKD